MIMDVENQNIGEIRGCVLSKVRKGIRLRMKGEESKLAYKPI